MNSEILILGDDRPGTLSQALGLAEALNETYQIISLKYNKLAFLPNFIFSKSLIRLSKETKTSLDNIQTFPKFIISAGRKSATAALYLKEKSQGASKVIQIMNPNLPFDEFDLVILPKHDQAQEHENLITTIGALGKITSSRIISESEKFSPSFATEKKYKITLMLGGSSKKTSFSKASAIKLAKICSNIAQNMEAKLFILNSRRTGDKLSEVFTANLKCDYRFFDWKDLGNENPYFAALGLSDFFIVTGDSVSMISECCFTGKPVYIFDEKEISSAKHRRFHENLFDENYARKLEENMVNLENFAGKKLQETKRIASFIKEKF